MPASIDSDHLLAGLTPRPLHGFPLASQLWQPPYVYLVPTDHTALFLPSHRRPLLIRLPPLELLPEAVGLSSQSGLAKSVLHPR
jgi:hypothetical protein